MTKAETIALQRDLYRLGFYAGPIDGIYGQNTERAYSDYWATRHVEDQVQIAVPDPATPWWASRGIWGALLMLLSVPASLLLGVEYDPQEAADVLMPVIQLIPEAMGAIGALLAWWGRRNAKAPIDPTLVARVGRRDVRLPSRVYNTRVPADDPRGSFGVD